MGWFLKITMPLSASIFTWRFCQNIWSLTAWPWITKEHYHTPYRVPLSAQWVKPYHNPAAVRLLPPGGKSQQGSMRSSHPTAPGCRMEPFLPCPHCPARGACCMMHQCWRTNGRYWETPPVFLSLEFCRAWWWISVLPSLTGWGSGAKLCCVIVLISGEEERKGLWITTAIK